MKFMLLMFNNHAAWDRLSPAEQSAAVEGLMHFGDELAAQGKLLLTQGLAPPNEAVSVRLAADGGRTVVDGPFAETREVVGGYYLIECGSQAEAVEWAKKLPL